MNQYIKVGIFEWVEFSARDGFYPDDLPREWRLAYFSNEFDSACLCLASVAGQSNLLMQWIEDLPDSFELSFCLDHVDQLQFFVHLIEHQQLKLKSLILGTSNSDILLQIKSLKSVLCAAGITQHDQIIELSSLWRPEIISDRITDVALFEHTDTVRQLRFGIDSWLQTNQSERNLTLWLPGSSTNYQLLSECRTLVELMGY